MKIFCPVDLALEQFQQAAFEYFEAALVGRTDRLDMLHIEAMKAFARFDDAERKEEKLKQAD